MEWNSSLKWGKCECLPCINKAVGPGAIAAATASTTTDTVVVAGFFFHGVGAFTPARGTSLAL